ncbi:MAG TPA: hypothetical protein VGM77_04280 [Gemmatimonadales bacterium]|jgi:hypothetical protein
MTTTPDDLPTPEFRAHLAWEVARTFRREARLGVRTDITRRRRIRMVATVAVCLALGTVSGLASAQVRDTSRRDSLLDAARAEMAIDTLRLDLAKRLDLDLSRQFAAGIASSDQAASAEAELRAQQTRVARLQLDIAEIQASSRAPREDLTAPRVGSRDFVSERINLDLMKAQQDLTAAEQAVTATGRQVRVGMIDTLALAQRQVELARAHATLAVLAERLAARRDFLDKGLSADQLARRVDQVQVQSDMTVAQQALATAQLRAEQLSRQQAAGAASELAALRAQVDLKERTMELNELAAQLKRLRTTQP